MYFVNFSLRRWEIINKAIIKNQFPPVASNRCDNRFGQFRNITSLFRTIFGKWWINTKFSFSIVIIGKFVGEYMEWENHFQVLCVQTLNLILYFKQMNISIIITSYSFIHLEDNQSSIKSFDESFLSRWNLVFRYKFS